MSGTRGNALWGSGTYFARDAKQLACVSWFIWMVDLRDAASTMCLATVRCRRSARGMFMMVASAVPEWMAAGRYCFFVAAGKLPQAVLSAIGQRRERTKALLAHERIRLPRRLRSAPLFPVSCMLCSAPLSLFCSAFPVFSLAAWASCRQIRSTRACSHSVKVVTGASLASEDDFVGILWVASLSALLLLRLSRYNASVDSLSNPEIFVRHLAHGSGTNASG